MTSLVFGSRFPVGSSARITCGRLMRRARSPRAAARPGELAGPVLHAIAEADLGEGRRREIAHFARWLSLDQGGNHRVLGRAHVAEQVVELEHEADVPAPIARESGLVRDRPDPRPGTGRAPPWVDRGRPAGATASTSRRPRRRSARRTRRARSVTLAPRRTRTTSGPRPILLLELLAGQQRGRAASLIAENVHRDERSGAPRRE